MKPPSLSGKIDQHRNESTLFRQSAPSPRTISVTHRTCNKPPLKRHFATTATIAVPELNQFSASENIKRNCSVELYDVAETSSARVYHRQHSCDSGAMQHNCSNTHGLQLLMQQLHHEVASLRRVTQDLQFQVDRLQRENYEYRHQRQQSLPLPAIPSGPSAAYIEYSQQQLQPPPASHVQQQLPSDRDQSKHMSAISGASASTYDVDVDVDVNPAHLFRPSAAAHSRHHLNVARMRPSPKTKRIRHKLSTKSTMFRDEEDDLEIESKVGNLHIDANLDVSTVDHIMPTCSPFLTPQSLYKAYANANGQDESDEDDELLSCSMSSVSTTLHEKPSFASLPLTPCNSTGVYCGYGPLKSTQLRVPCTPQSHHVLQNSISVKKNTPKH